MRKAIASVWILLIINVASAQVPGDDSAANKSARPPRSNEARMQLMRKLAELKALQSEIEQLRREAGVGPQNILLRVQVIDVSRSKLKQRGYDLEAQGVASVLRDAAAERTAPLKHASDRTPESADAGGLDFAVLDRAAGLEKLLVAWKEQGIVLKIIGEPNIMTVSGRAAFVQIGGRFPTLTYAPNGELKTEMQPYGVQLDAVPWLLDDGSVKLNLRPRISEIDASQTFTINGATVPVLRTREFDTGVVLKPGQTFAASGLSVAERRTKRPWSIQKGDDHNEIDRLILTRVEIADAASQPSLAASGKND